jgi:anti-sigma-K factor RskA
VQCQGFATEEYDLYALGIAEPDQDSAINEHLTSSCDVCRKGVRESLRFWALYGASLSPADAKRGSSNLQALPVRHRTAPTYWRLAGIAAMVALLVGSGVWLVVSGASQHAMKQLSAELAAARAQVTQLQAQNPNPPTPKPSVPSPAEVPAGNADRAAELSAQLRTRELELGGLRKSLEDVDGRYQKSMADLVTERANAAQLTTTLAQQKEQLEKDAAEQRRLSAQMETLSASLRTSEERTRRLTAEAVSLNQEKARLLETVQRMEIQAGEGRRMISLLSVPGTRLIAVNGTEAAPQARGYALLSDRNRIVFYATDLPALPNGRVYQLWLIREKSPAIVSAGVFTAQPSRSAEVEFARGDMVQGVTAIAVTDEPAGGSPIPTGHKLLTGLTRS